MGSGKSDPKPTGFGLNVGLFCEEMMKALGVLLGSIDRRYFIRNIGCIESKLSEGIQIGLHLFRLVVLFGQRQFDGKRATHAKLTRDTNLSAEIEREVLDD